MMNRTAPTCLLLLLTVVLLAGAAAGRAEAQAKAPPTNYFYEQGAIIDQVDPIGDDKGPGYYQYPLDKRMRRGTFDLKRFSVYEEGNVYVFKLQMREYIMTEWPDTRRSEEQGFVALAFDIYLDLDRRPGLGYKKALPGREVVFADDMGWEKVIMVTPYSQSRVYDIIKHKTDDLSFQNMVPDVVLPDYVQIQRDTIILRLGKDQIGPISDRTGFQCFVMGFSHVVSVNRLLTRDVRGFATNDDFGGGWDTRGDPPIMDLIVPEGADQYALLREYRSEPYRDRIEYVKIPFVYPSREEILMPVTPDADVSSLMTPLPRVTQVPAPVARPPAPRPAPVAKLPAGSPSVSFDAGFVPLATTSTVPAKPARVPGPARTARQTQNATTARPTRSSGNAAAAPAVTTGAGGFVPLRAASSPLSGAAPRVAGTAARPAAKTATVPARVAAAAEKPRSPARPVRSGAPVAAADTFLTEEESFEAESRDDDDLVDPEFAGGEPDIALTPGAAPAMFVPLPNFKKSSGR